jgi:hypothetical protein
VDSANQRAMNARHAILTMYLEMNRVTSIIYHKVTSKACLNPGQVSSSPQSSTPANYLRRRIGSTHRPVTCEHMVWHPEERHFTAPRYPKENDPEEQAMEGGCVMYCILNRICFRLSGMGRTLYDMLLLRRCQMQRPCEPLVDASCGYIYARRK